MRRDPRLSARVGRPLKPCLSLMPRGSVPRLPTEEAHGEGRSDRGPWQFVSRARIPRSGAWRPLRSRSALREACVGQGSWDMILVAARASILDDRRREGHEAAVLLGLAAFFAPSDGPVRLSMGATGSCTSRRYRAEEAGSCWLGRWRQPWIDGRRRLVSADAANKANSPKVPRGSPRG
jgi:hypothetical protein